MRPGVYPLLVLAFLFGWSAPVAAHPDAAAPRAGWAQAPRHAAHAVPHGRAHRLHAQAHAAHRQLHRAHFRAHHRAAPRLRAARVAAHLPLASGAWQDRRAARHPRG